MPEGGDSFNGLPCWLFACDMACSWAVNHGDWKITTLVVRARLEPKG